MADDHDATAEATVDEDDPDEETLAAERARREVRDGQNPAPDPEDEARAREALDQENKDDHRDEPPHES